MLADADFQGANNGFTSVRKDNFHQACLWRKGVWWTQRVRADIQCAHILIQLQGFWASKNLFFRLRRSNQFHRFIFHWSVGAEPIWRGFPIPLLGRFFLKRETGGSWPTFPKVPWERDQVFRRYHSFRAGNKMGQAQTHKERTRERVQRRRDTSNLRSWRFSSRSHGEDYRHPPQEKKTMRIYKSAFQEVVFVSISAHWDSADGFIKRAGVNERKTSNPLCEIRPRRLATSHLRSLKLVFKQKGEKVSEIVGRIVDARRQAPSPENVQPWKWLVISVTLEDNWLAGNWST